MMALSHKHRQDIENLNFEIEKSIAADESAAVNSVRESSETLRRVDPGLVRGFLRREVAADADAASAWNNRAERPEHWQAITQRAAQKMEAAIERLHGDGSGDDDGVNEESVVETRRQIREIAGIDGRVSSSLLEAALAEESGVNDRFAQSWDNRASRPGEWNGTLRNFAFGARQAFDQLANATRPQSTLPGDVDMRDLMEMDEKSWARFKRQAMKSQGGK
jgi:hypothetical protein